MSATFVEWDHPSPFLDAIGGFRRHPTDPLRLGFVVEGAKVNGRGFLHAGTVAAIADAAIGHAIAALTDPPTRLVTVNLSCDLLGTAERGDWVDVEVELTKTGRRLAAGTATFRTRRPIAVVTALFVPQAA
jgi:acyl-coenzyme A thioesterase PaaI-like protein